jgi:hypothetical protein
MDDTLPYARRSKKRLSKLAVASCIVGLSGLPVWFASMVLAFLSQWMPLIVAFYALPVLLPLCGIVLGIVALRCIKRPGRPGIWPPTDEGLTGRAWATVGIVASLIWPLAVVAFFRWAANQRTWG